METIKAAVCHDFGAPLTIEAVTLRPPERDEITVEIKAVAICHSDISLSDGAWGGPLPAVYGHEAAGIVTAKGPDVHGIAPGDSVVVTLIRPCGSCLSCLGGRPTICQTAPASGDSPITLPDGSPLHQGLACGAFAQKVVVSARQVVVIADDIPMTTASVIGCGVITGVGAVVHSAALRAGEDVVVIGAGGVGLNAVQGARLAGARRIVAVDMLPEKLEDARAFGATDTVLATDKSAAKQVSRTLGRRADVVLVTVGAVPAYNTALKYLGWGGRMIMVGMPHAGDTAEYEPSAQSFMGQQLRGSKMGDVVIQRDIPWIVDLYRQGRLELDALVSRTWAFEDINDAIADTRTGRARRNVIVF